MNLMDRAHKKPNSTLYIAFVDLKKAFDKVWREGLWKALERKGLGGKFLRIVKGLYQDHRKRIKIGNRLSDWIKCDRGVRQGCVLSPMLFALLVDDLGDWLAEAATIQVGAVLIPGMFFADDMAIFADSELPHTDEYSDRLHRGSQTGDKLYQNPGHENG